MSLPSDHCQRPSGFTIPPKETQLSSRLPNVIRIVLFVMMGSATASGQAPPPNQLLFPPPRDTQSAPAGITPPAKAREQLAVPPGFQVRLFAAEPEIRQPIAMATDARGRLWVAENYTYAERETNFDLSQRDRIVILDDTDGDGSADRRTVFWDQASKLTSVEVGFGGVWALCAPYLLFIPDRNGDDIPDGEPIVMLDGWDADAVRHNIVNGLRWGPDGWLYGRHGILATSHVGVPGSTPDQRQAINCGLWRFHPTQQRFEIVCHGTTNSWGHDWDEHGQLFFINTVIGHLWHVLPGARYQRMYGQDFNPHSYALIPQTADHFHWDTAEAWSDIRNKGVTPTTSQAGGGHAHSGMAIYQGGLWPRRYHNTLFTVNLHGMRINNDRLVRRNAGYVGTHEPDFAISSDPWFRAVEVMAAHDGNLYVADWSDTGECHENDGVHRSSGRIFKIDFVGDAQHDLPVEAEFTPRRDLDKSTTSHLVSLQTVRNEWQVRQARRTLQERAAAGADMSSAQAELIRLFHDSSDTRHQLRALWALHSIGGATREILLETLNHPSEHVRSWGIKLLADEEPINSESLARLVSLAAGEPSGLVRLHLASVLQNLAISDRGELARRIVANGNDAHDPVLPLLLWYGMEPFVAASPVAAVDILRHAKMPPVREFIARRVVQEIERTPDAVDALTHIVAHTDDTDLRRDVLKGMTDGLRGWRQAARPASWTAATARMEVDGTDDERRWIRDLAVVFGDGRAVDDLFAAARSLSETAETRRAAIRSLAAIRAPGLIDALQKLLPDRDLQLDVIRALGTINDPAVPKLLMENMNRFYSTTRQEAINALVSRPSYCNVLLDGVAAKKVDRSLIASFQLRQMETYGDADISRRIRELWPELQAQADDKRRQIAALHQRLQPQLLARADLENGKALFTRMCANCHRLFGTGGTVGPDLTGGQRGNLHYLLENIIDPSSTVSENYRMTIVITTDGRILNGVAGARTERTVELQTPTERLTLALDDIEEMRTSNLSIMPEGQLNLLDPDHIRDLIGFLMQGATRP